MGIRSIDTIVEKSKKKRSLFQQHVSPSPRQKRRVAETSRAKAMNFSTPTMLPSSKAISCPTDSQFWEKRTLRSSSTATTASPTDTTITNSTASKTKPVILKCTKRSVLWLRRPLTNASTGIFSSPQRSTKMALLSIENDEHQAASDH